ncbi:paxneb superfamily protein-like protein [Zopfia rhizophila CBS 207.26]|uniref:Elongator complex protein 4 n=1 Tax=Zopfia rhizophila CBS 207.26 TaxID=1314779 RepID=A0A6A6E8F8_9PEZI|nr:paxneb superfamily protein-like protein [Zopfia rhizophila CBS 207.26]
MAFRKRNIALSCSGAGTDPNLPSSPPSPSSAQTPPGVRPSPIDGRPTTSTGTPSLDSILAGHAGLPLGNSILIGETGTTDYAGALLRFYAAEGVVQGHTVHVVGMTEAWGRELPGLVVGREEERREKGEKMKIAWRYESMGQFVSERGSSGVKRAPLVAASETSQPGLEESTVFCHIFDLAKRLTFPVSTAINYIPIPPNPTSSPFIPILQNLQHQLSSSPHHRIHRVVIPSMLSPALYPPHSPHPHSILQFLHAFRALLRAYPTRLTALLTIPLSLYPRTSGVVRWMEILSDGVFELLPFPHNPFDPLSTSGAATRGEERPQGLFMVHKVPVWNERGGAGGGLGEDLAFTVSRRKFLVQNFSLPPIEGDREAQEGAAAAGGSGIPNKTGLEF